MITLVLRAMRYSLMFQIQELSFEPAIKGYYCTGAFSLTSPSIELKPAIDYAASFPLTDLKDLATWMRDHIARLPVDPSSLRELMGAGTEPRVWVPLDLSANIWLLAGEKSILDDGTDEGEFGLLVTLLVDDDTATSGRLYYGLESSIEIAEAFRFCNDVDRLYEQPESWE